MFIPSHAPFYNGHLLTDSAFASMIEFGKFIGVTIPANIRCSSHIFNCIKQICPPSFKIRRLRQFGAKQTTITPFVHQCPHFIAPQLSFQKRFLITLPKSTYHQSCFFYSY